MIHKMKLQPKYYDFILHGTKRIEIRLNDEKRQQIKIGDNIIFFKEPQLIENFKVEVTNLFKYKNIEDMTKDFDISLLADKSITKEELISNLEQFYSKEKQKEYGILCIEIKLI